MFSKSSLSELGDKICKASVQQKKKKIHILDTLVQLDWYILEKKGEKEIKIYFFQLEFFPKVLKWISFAISTFAIIEEMAFQ